jgi:hypothetical protein
MRAGRCLSIAAIAVAFTWSAAAAPLTPQQRGKQAKPAAAKTLPGGLKRQPGLAPQVKLPKQPGAVAPRGLAPGQPAVTTRTPGSGPAAVSPNNSQFRRAGTGGPQPGAGLGRPQPGTAAGTRTGPGGAAGAAQRKATLPGAGGGAGQHALGNRRPGALQRQHNIGATGPRGPNALGARQTSLPGAFQQRAAFTRAGAAWRTMSLRYHVAPPRSLGPPPGFGIGRSRHEMMFSGVPPRAEVRYLPREWVVQIADEVPRAQIDMLAGELGVTVVASQSFGFGGRTVYHFRSTGERDVSELIRRMEQNRIVAAAQPNYVYRVTQLAPRVRPADLPPLVPPAAPPAGADAASLAAAETLPAGDASQYAIDKLNLRAVHQQARGRGIAIAVIDSEIDGRHPDIQRAVKERFDPTGSRSSPDTHGTGMAGAIASRHRLLGVAPDAEIVAIRAFDNKAGGAEATSFQILKGLDHAMRRNVRVINMSFAGPYDGMIERKLQEAYGRGIVLVAAAGNAGPKSPPLYPAASPSVIGVTALDATDHPFLQGNQGKHVAIAAPGVDILVPAPNDTYQMTTGTSVAAAHVSGVVALMLEKRPELTPDDVRAIIAGSATAIAVTKEARTGAGLINPLKALSYDLPADSVAPVASAAPAAPAGRGPGAAGSAARTTGGGAAATAPRTTSAPIAPGPRTIGAAR